MADKKKDFNTSKVLVSVPKSRRMILKDALNNYKLNLENSPSRGKKIDRLISHIDEMLLATEAELVFKLDTIEFVNYEKKHGVAFPEFID